MIIFFQIPLADLRLFITFDSGKLPKPFWPTPSPKVDFLRNFGEVKRRKKGGVEGWVGENEICIAKHAVKLPSLIPYHHNNFHILLKVGGRHFYSDGDALAKFEIIFLSQPRILSTTSQETLGFVDHLINLQSIVSPSNQNSEPATLATIGKNLAHLYLISSSDKKHLQGIKNTWIKSGESIVVLEGSSKEKISLPKATTVTVPNFPIQLHHWWQKNGNNPEISTWVIQKHSESKETKAQSRLIRIILMRLHAEQQCLGLVLRAVATKDINFNDDQIENRIHDWQLQNFQKYLNHATSTILRLNRDVENYFESNKVEELIRKSLEKNSPGNWDALRRQLENFQMRPQVNKQINNYINNVYIKEQVMGNKYENRGQVGAMGPNAHLENVQIIQNNNSINDADLKKLSKELSVLKKEMKKLAKDPEHALAIGAVSAAEQAAKKNDSKKTIEFLKSAGSWALDVATKVGVGVAISAIKSSMGLP